MDRERQRQRGKRERDRQTDRQTDSQTARQTEAERGTERDRDRKTERASLLDVAVTKCKVKSVAACTITSTHPSYIDQLGRWRGP